MHRVIVGTAGHIDHGKTRLIQAITGIDCDRWSEERERGITIDLGFAHLDREDLQLGFIDVPGHERFLHNALAGLGGIRIMLLVVAADEGIKPQTLEHLDICKLLHIPRAVVAITKSDAVSEDLAELARLEVEDLMAGSPWPEASVLAVSSATLEGVPRLVERLVAEASDLPDLGTTTGPTRLPIDRAFQLKGLGSIVTGTLVSGSIAPGDTLSVLPGAVSGKVRSVQVHGQERERALAGERAALQLAGVPVRDLERGLQLVTAGAFTPSTSVLIDLELLPNSPVALTGSTPIRLHLFSGEVIGRLRVLDVEGALEPGGRAVAEVRLAAPVTAARGDRVIIRRPSPPATLGGGRVLDPLWARRRGARLRRAITGLAGTEASAVNIWVEEAGLAGLSAKALAGRLACPLEDAEALLATGTEEGRLAAIEPGGDRPTLRVRPSSLTDLEEAATKLLAGYLERERLAAGMPKAEVIRRLLPSLSQDLGRVYLEYLAERNVIEIRDDLVTQPGREAQLTGEESGLAGRLERLYVEAGLTPPSPADAARSTESKPQIVEGVIQYLVQRSALLRLPGGLFISSAAIEDVARRLAASTLEDFTVAEFKEMFGISRKWAIPILEHLDARRVTHRLGDVRRIVRPGQEAR